MRSIIRVAAFDALPAVLPAVLPAILPAVICIAVILPTAGLGASEESVSAGSTALILSLESHTYSDPTPIDSFIHEFEGDFEPGDYAFTYNLAEAGIMYGNWGLSVIQRYDHFYSFSPDTARFYRETENSLPQNAGDNYQIYLDGNHIRASGLKLQFAQDISPSFHLSGALSYLDASEFYRGGVQGSLDVDAGLDYAGQLQIQLDSFRDVVLEYPVTGISGKGYSLDIGFHWDLRPNLEWTLTLRDAVNRISWEDALVSGLTLTTANRQVDSDGNVSITPLLSGTQRLQSPAQRLPEKLFTSLDYALSPRHALSMGLFHTDYFTHGTVAYSYAFNPAHKLTFIGGLNTSALGFNYESPFGNIGLVMDAMDYEDAKAVSLTFTLRIELFQGSMSVR